MTTGRAVTLADIAEKVGVSTVTVSNAIGGRPGVSNRVRKRVMDAATQLGYIPNLSARSLAGGRTGIVGVIVPTFNQYIAEILRGVAETLKPSDLDLLVYTTSDNREREKERVTQLSRGLADGLIEVMPFSTAEIYNGGAQLPVVLIDQRGDAPDLPAVGSDNYMGARAATEHLIGLGHERIGFITGVPNMRASDERLRGYREALLTAGLGFDDQLVQAGDFTQTRGSEAAGELLALKRAPTAIFAANDLSAFGVIEAVRTRGLFVPGDLSVVGFDNIPMASQVQPPLTTVDQSLYDMGQAAARTLLGLLSGIEPAVKYLRLPTRLVERHSTALRTHQAKET